ncbi:MAG: orotidine-5'-phosphate decarboxylase [Candidatus Omnitrophica bacterium]|nr:orotidine-5'-phosphate decarboxylase [Candidatus Omnitrophota bacterium]MCM8833417.1 orotidine-5'-phosphate decarboxylase [Candidatus Omnitrophota bacterium]
MGKLIVALDLNNKNKIYNLIERLGNRVDYYKVGIIPYFVCGEEIIKKLKKQGKKIFLDFKFFDIPNTVRKISEIIFEEEIDMFTVHLIAGEQVIKSIVETKQKLKTKTKIIGVTILTSFTEKDISFLNINTKIDKLVEKLVDYGYNWGIDGVVCSGEEIEMIRTKYNPPFLIIVPGVRIDEKNKKDDQKRIITPKEAIKKGADFVVVGRPIYENLEPEKVVEKILKEIEDGTKNLD